MTFNPKLVGALLGAAALAWPASALAKDDKVSRQANEVVEQAQDLQKAAAKLDNKLANASESDRDRDGARDDRDRGDNRDRNGDRDDGDSGKWGLLGLLGLAGLLGLRRRDDGHHHHVDRDYDRTTTTTAGMSGGARGSRSDTRL